MKFKIVDVSVGTAVQTPCTLCLLRDGIIKNNSTCTIVIAWYKEEVKMLIM